MQRNSLFIALGLFFISQFALADIWQGARTHAAGKGAIGAFGMLYVDPTDFNLFLNGTYGVNPGLQAEARFGFGTTDSYIGGFLKQYVSELGSFATFSMWGGVHHQASTFIDAAPILSRDFSNLEVYMSPQLILKLIGPSHFFNMAFNLGGSMAVTNGLRTYLEFTGNITHYYNALSGGVRYFF